MPSRFRVRWTESAVADLEGIIRFIAKDSPANAGKLYQRIRKRADSLRTFPQRGHLVSELAKLKVMNYRELDVYPYRIVYKTDQANVFVLAVLDGRRDLREILAERVLRK